MTSKERIQQAKNYPILELAERLELQIARDKKALCPFHAEKTASLAFNPSNNLWKCFGCGAHGDSIALVMKLENKTFSEAVQWILDEYVSPRQLAAFNTSPRSLKSSGEIFSDVYEGFNKMLPYPVSNHYLIKERKLTQNVLIENEIRAIPTDQTWDIKDKLLSMFPEERLINSGLFAPNKSGNGFHLFFWKCHAVIPWYIDGKIIHIQGVNIRIENENINIKVKPPKYLHLSGINKPTLYIPKNFPSYDPQTTSIHVTESAIDALSVLEIGEIYNKNFKAVGIVDAGITKLDEFNRIKEFPIILVGDFDKIGIEAKIRIYNYLKENNFDVQSISVFKIAKKFGIPEEIAFKLKDMNDILKIIKKERFNDSTNK